MEGDTEVYLHFRTLSTNESHPRAISPKISIDAGTLAYMSDVEFPMSVMGNSVGSFCQWLSHTDSGTLFVFDWCTGALLTVWKSVQFLSYTEFIIFPLEHRIEFFCVH